MVGGYPSAYAGGLGGFGGIGGLGLVGLIGLNSLWGNRGWGVDGGPNGAGVVANTVADQNISELRKDVQGVNTTVQALGNEIQSALSQQTLGQNANFANLNNRLCDSEKDTMQGFFNIQTQALLNTQSIKDQSAAQQVINQENFCQLRQQINADGDATRALINSINEQNLRDRLQALETQVANEQRNRSFREIEINVAQTNQQTQNQLQAQLQSQTQFFANALNMLGDQINRQTNSLINIGSGTVAGSGQSANQANTKVNS